MGSIPTGGSHNRRSEARWASLDQRTIALSRLTDWLTGSLWLTDWLTEMTLRRGHGEGSVYRRSSDGRWIGVVDLGHSGGKRRRRSVTAATKRQCLAKLRELQADMSRGVITGSSSVSEWLTYWLDEIASETVRPTTLRGYRQKVGQWIEPELGRHRLDRLSPEHIRALHRSMERAGAADGTRRTVHAILRRALVVAEREGRVSRNVAALVEAPPSGHRTHGRLSTDDARRVMQTLVEGWGPPEHPAWRGSRYAAAILAGLRQGEALGLRWGDVDMVSGLIVVRRSVAVVAGQIIEGPPKSARGMRVVPIGRSLADMLERDVRGDDEDLVWPGRDGRPMSGRHDWGGWKRLLADAGVVSVPLHAARATAASLMMEAGQPDVVIAEILGHAAVQVTQDHYLHADDRMRRSAVSALEDLLGMTR